MVTFACRKFAEELRRALDEAEIDYDPIDIESRTGRIWSDEHGLISENGFHTGTEINGTVYDNMNPNGKSTGDWLRDLGVGEGHPGLSVNK